MDAAGGPGNHAMSCAISTTPATSPAGATTTTLAPATTIAATATVDRGSSFAAGSQEAKDRFLVHLADIAVSANVCRSEEHTSELQSPDHLVCRLLLEKKKKTQYHTKSESAVVS